MLDQQNCLKEKIFESRMQSMKSMEKTAITSSMTAEEKAEQELLEQLN